MSTKSSTIPPRPHLTNYTWGCLIISLSLFIADFVFRQQHQAALKSGLNHQLLVSSGANLKQLNFIQVQDVILTIALILSIQAIVELIIKNIRIANYLLTLRITAVLILVVILYFSYTPTASVYKDMAHSLLSQFDQLFLPLVISPHVSPIGSVLSIAKYGFFVLAVLSVPPYRPLITPWQAQRIKTKQNFDDQNPCDSKKF
ncbi:hypothetical protein [Lapidilactobacillus wuchangensis]|uniref:hypothetical protein n=1 Tax=Lapidilactobacillus wuchangensis TaxID=2486001 RepID=UPI000F77FD41|nr:hypothetical protein [Lapidilactobacillus wuchangensis]